SIHIIRAEVPGPVVGKLVPKMRDTAKILYAIYGVMTIVETILLCCGGLSFYDALLHSFSTAGTGGFSTYSNGIAAFNSAYVEIVITVFMILFGVNFNLYYLLLIRRFRAAVSSEELHVYLLVVFASAAAIAVGITKLYGNFGTAVRYAFFNVAAIISTTGFTQSNFIIWPQYCQIILLLLMILGSCAGSTGGGVKVSRVIILIKSAWADARQSVHTREVKISHMDGKTISGKATRSVYSFFILYLAALILSTIILSLVGCDLTASFSGSLACLSNVGPGLSVFGPFGSYSFLPTAVKLYLAVLMIFGRLEIYPILMLLLPSVWKRQPKKN
ncbi:MAG: TrkH family potassium uptake protein, partial [Oscillospiraceae bacterium]|nr:TrkH family potassium uptake protein [Oscillospiraceae bacterium]